MLIPVRAGSVLLLAVLMSAAAPIARPASLQAELTIIVDHLRSAKGDVRLALWDLPDRFTDGDAAIVRVRQPAVKGQVRFTIPNLRPGRYALATFHDENGNGEFDRTWLGLPDEGLGFSNGAWIGLDPPSFEEAAVEVSTETQTIVISLRY